MLADLGLGGSESDAGSTSQAGSHAGGTSGSDSWGGGGTDDEFEELHDR